MSRAVLKFGSLHRVNVAPSIPCGVEEGGGIKMSVEPEGWHMDPGPPSWDPEAKSFSFFLHKRDQESVFCIVAMDALENAVQSSELSEPALIRIFEAHRQMIELRAAQKLNAGLLDSNSSVLVGADDI
jgi:Protein of unknown function (DUF1488)